MPLFRKFIESFKVGFAISQGLDKVIGGGEKGKAADLQLLQNIKTEKKNLAHSFKGLAWFAFQMGRFFGLFAFKKVTKVAQFLFDRAKEKAWPPPSNAAKLSENDQPAAPIQGPSNGEYSTQPASASAMATVAAPSVSAIPSSTDSPPVSSSSLLTAVSTEQLAFQLPAVRQALLPHFDNARIKEQLQQTAPGFMFVGAGKVGTVVKTTLKGRECFIRPVRSPDAENKGFINTPYGHLYEPSTKADPQVAARSAACSRIGQQMARLSGLLSPTFDCQIVADSDNPDSVSVVMTSAGDKSMHEAKKSQIPVTENMLQSSLMVQILHRITGQLDGHSENVMFDSKTGHLCAIDPGMTFPPFALGSNCGQLIQNMAARYRAVAPGWENTSQEAAENFIKGKEKTFFRGILPELPPLTERMKAMLRQMTTDPERAQLLKELEDSGKFTSQELAMTEERLDVLAQQIDTVPTVPEGGYLELWSQPNSPFTTENCWLRRLYEGKM